MTAAQRLTVSSLPNSILPMLAAVGAALMLLLALAQPASAQDPSPRGPLGAAPPAAERGLNALRPSAAKPVAAAEMGVVERTWAWVLATQQRLNRELVTAVRGLKSDPVNATFVLAWLSFAYGVLHAAGPGHGKAVISAYVLANERTVKRGILLSFLAAFFQALSALLIVGILSVALKATSLTMKSAEAWIETLSWALVAGVGAWLLYGQLKPFVARRAARATSAAAAPVPAHGPGHGHDLQHAHTHAHAHHQHDHAGCCGHDHDHAHHDHGHGGHGLAHGQVQRQGQGQGHAPRAAAAPGGPRPAAVHAHADGHRHAHAHDHGPDCGCGHDHIPSPRDLEGAWSWSKALALAVSVGIRPCTGAILVLLFAISQGLMWAGVMATFAMAIGTAITVSVLAALAVGSRELATRLAGSAGGGWAAAVSTAVGIVGASLVLLMGVAFFLASLKGPAPF